MGVNMSINNKNLNKAKRDKIDEFYTLYEDVEKEMKHWKDYLKGKIVYCNCDGEQSQFVRYFKNYPDIKELIYTSNDFRLPENIENLKRADVIITNPPFSLFREYIDTLYKYNKDFIIIGNMNAITFKNIFPHIKDGTLFVNEFDTSMTFLLPDNATKYNKEIDGKKYASVSISWYTNILSREKKILTLTKNYDPKLYPKYDNYDAINVNKIKDIPKDYCGVIGVPITIFSYHKGGKSILLDGNEYKLIGTIKTHDFDDIGYLHNTGTYKDPPLINGKELYTRLLIQKI